MTDRRHSNRLPIIGFVDITTAEKNRVTSGFIEQISRSGMGIYTKEKIRQGSRVSLDLLCFVGNDSLTSTITGIVTSSVGLVSSVKKTRELGVVAIKFDKEINSSDQESLHRLFTTDKPPGTSKRKGFLRLV